MQAVIRLTAILAAIAASIGAYVLLTSTAPVGIPYQDRSKVAAGAAVYASHCASCHGTELEGQPNWQYPDMEGYMPAPPQNGTGHTHDHPDLVLFNTVKLGPEATVCTNRKSRMGGYADILEDEEIMAVLAFIKSTWPDEVIRAHNRVNGRPG